MEGESLFIAFFLLRLSILKRVRYFTGSLTPRSKFVFASFLRIPLRLIYGTPLPNLHALLLSASSKATGDEAETQESVVFLYSYSEQLNKPNFITN